MYLFFFNFFSLIDCYHLQCIFNWSLHVFSVLEIKRLSWTLSFWVHINICFPQTWWDSYDIESSYSYFTNKSPSSQSYGFSSSHVWMWELDYNESWAPKNWCFWTVVLKKSPLDCKEIQQVNPKGNQSWIFIERTDAEAETPILWPPDVKSWLIGKDPNAGKDWGQKEKGATEDEMAGWHHWLDGHEFE